MFEKQTTVSNHNLKLILQNYLLVYENDRISTWFYVSKIGFSTLIPSKLMNLFTQSEEKRNAPIFVEKRTTKLTQQTRVCVWREAFSFHVRMHEKQIKLMKCAAFRSSYLLNVVNLTRKSLEFCRRVAKRSK